MGEQDQDQLDCIAYDRYTSILQSKEEVERKPDADASKASEIVSAGVREEEEDPAAERGLTDARKASEIVSADVKEEEDPAAAVHAKEVEHKVNNERELVDTTVKTGTKKKKATAIMAGSTTPAVVIVTE